MVRHFYFLPFLMILEVFWSISGVLWGFGGVPTGVLRGACVRWCAHGAVSSVFGRDSGGFVGFWGFWGVILRTHVP